MRKPIFITIIVAAFLGIYLYSAHIAISGSCMNSNYNPATGKSYFKFTFLQNSTISFSSTELQNRLTIVENQLRDWMIPHPSYEVSVNTDIQLYANNIYSGPPSILDASTQYSWTMAMCAQNASRVGTPYILMINDLDDNGNIIYRPSSGYTSWECNVLSIDPYWHIMLPYSWTPTLLFHEFGHSVNLDHLNVQAYNVMWNGGCESGMGSAIDRHQAVFFHWGTCVGCTNPYSYPEGTYPATPVEWCPG